MDPYDIPSTTEVKKCLKHWGTKDFEDEFVTELIAHEADLPLLDMCKTGNPKSDEFPELDDLRFDAPVNDMVKGSVVIRFIEVTPTGCSSSENRRHISGRIGFTLNLKTGEVVFDPPRLVREYEEEEF